MGTAAPDMRPSGSGYRVMRKGFTVFAAAVVASLVATPMVISATNALATPEHTEAPATWVDVRPAAPAPVAPCAPRKVRVIYTGYAAAPAGCAVR